MTVKEYAKQIIDSLPESSSLDDIIHALYIKAKVEHGESEIRRGYGIANGLKSNSAFE